MKKNILLYILLAFLILVNGFFLIQYLGKPDKKGPRGPGSFLAKELQFDTSQMEQFNKIEEGHQERIHVFVENSNKLKEELFDELSDTSANQQEIDSIISLIGKNAKAKELETFNHLRAVQDICNDAQKEKFRIIVKDALRRGRGRKGGPPPPPR